MEKVSAIWHHAGMAKDEYPSDAADRFQVRMPPGMRERIAEAAKGNNRSMNAEIVSRLEDSLNPLRGLKNPDINRQAKRFMDLFLQLAQHNADDDRVYFIASRKIGEDPAKDAADGINDDDFTDDPSAFE